MKLVRVIGPVVAVVAGVVLAGCSGSPNPESTPGVSDVITVVASTTVYGDLAATVGGDAVEVTSIIDDPNKDPHEYEASAQNQLALSKAQVVVKNGGGYDDFVGTMLDASGNDAAVLLDAVTISGKTAAAGDELNEHVWYDFPTVQKVIDQITATYSKLDPAEAATFQQNADRLNAKLDELIQREADLKDQFTGAPIAITEPVPLYLLEAVGLDNKTPDAFSEAIEEGTDVAPSVLLDTLSLFNSKQVRLLAYNEQTAGPQTEQVMDAAKQNGIPVVPVTETLPDGDTYVSWMSGTLDAVATALAS